MAKYVAVNGFKYAASMRFSTEFGVENGRLANVDAMGYAQYEVDGDVVAVLSQEQHDEHLNAQPKYGQKKKQVIAK